LVGVGAVLVLALPDDGAAHLPVGAHLGAEHEIADLFRVGQGRPHLLRRGIDVDLDPGGEAGHRSQLLSLDTSTVGRARYFDRRARAGRNLAERRQTPKSRLTCWALRCSTKNDSSGMVPASRVPTVRPAGQRTLTARSAVKIR